MRVFRTPCKKPNKKRLLHIRRQQNLITNSSTHSSLESPSEKNGQTARDFGSLDIHWRKNVPCLTRPPETSDCRGYDAAYGGHSGHTPPGHFQLAMIPSSTYYAWDMPTHAQEAQPASSSSSLGRTLGLMDQPWQPTKQPEPRQPPGCHGMAMLSNSSTVYSFLGGGPVTRSARMCVFKDIQIHV